MQVCSPQTKAVVAEAVLLIWTNLCPAMPTQKKTLMTVIWKLSIALSHLLRPITRVIVSMAAIPVLAYPLPISHGMPMKTLVKHRIVGNLSRSWKSKFETRQPYHLLRHIRIDRWRQTDPRAHPVRYRSGPEALVLRPFPSWLHPRETRLPFAQINPILLPLLKTVTTRDRFYQTQ